MTLKNLFLFLVLFPFVLSAQRNTPHTALAPGQLQPNEAITTYDLRKRTKIERVFFNDDWSEGKFIFSDNHDSQRTFPLKYDILNQELNVDLAGSIYVVPLDSIRGFLIENSLSLNDYKFIIRKTGKGAEIFETIVKGENQLLVKHTAEKLKADYQPALDTGSRDEKVIKKQQFYFLDKDGHLLEIPKQKKAAKVLFSGYSSAKKYLAKNKVNFKDKDSLRELVLFMNQN